MRGQISARIQGNTRFENPPTSPKLQVMPSTTPTTRLLYDRCTAALMLSISQRTLAYYIADGTIRTRRIGRRVLIPHSELIRFARADHFGPVARKRITGGSAEDILKAA